VLRLDRPHRSARQPLASVGFSLPPSQPSTLVHCLLLKHRCKIPANESHLFPPSQPPASLLLHSFHFISLHFSYPSGTTTPRIPTPLLHRSLLISGLDLLLGTQNVYKLPPFKNGNSIRLLRINLVVCFLLSLSCFPVSSVSSPRHSHSWNRCPPCALSRHLSLSLLSPHYLGRHPQSRSRYLSYNIDFTLFVLFILL